MKGANRFHVTADRQVAAARLTEGHCPICATRLKPYDAATLAAAQTWAHPPAGYCPACDGDAGFYTGDGLSAALGVRASYVADRKGGPLLPYINGQLPS